MFKPLSVFNRNRNAPALSGDGAPFVQLHHEMNRLFDDFFSDFGTPSLFAAQGGNGARAIHMDYRDTGKALVVEAELPGVSEDDVDVELQDNLLTIRGERKEEEDKQGVTRRSYASFQRSMSLPFDVDPDAVEAKFRNGVLTLTLPKPPELEARTRKIAVQKE